MSKDFNENTRVKLPALIALSRIGYKYLSIKKRSDIDKDTNIFKDIFFDSVCRLNPYISENELHRLLVQIKSELSNDDLGEAFYQHLIGKKDKTMLIDFAHPERNVWNVVTELSCDNGEDSFRPDITLLVNGMPLAFIEVKKPNNREGILAERKRIDARFKNTKFRRFINISQILVFSNNMEYEDEETEPWAGAFYCTAAKEKAFFNHFREDLNSLLSSAMPEDEDEDTVNLILSDNNYIVLKNNPEFIENKKLTTPTNRIILSLFSRNRFLEFLDYGIAYLKYYDDQGRHRIEKHIMRYPQYFASKAIQQKLDEGWQKGIIWHTQGSGKTALAYFNVKWLTEYFKNKSVPKFYFIVDRIDLQKQARDEFLKRGLKVNLINSREQFRKDIALPSAIHNDSGEMEITVVNIQKFSEDARAVESMDYDIHTQRIYFIDEAHRSYRPEGCFLSCLIESDRKAIMISLTGTPLLRKEKSDSIKLGSKDIFGDYIHKYYYNQSISDGYTLKLLREDIETRYKNLMKAALADIQIQKGSVREKYLFAHEKFATPMLEYIIDDLQKSRVRLCDNSIGAMVVCHSSEQAKELFRLFSDNEKLRENGLKAALILHDVNDKEFRATEIDAFKKGKIDILFVYNMLLTGFDAPRLKKMYLHRPIKDHNLLQTLTRVNRPYNTFKYGYVVDFVDITAEFDKANKAYWDELNSELGDEAEKFRKLFKTQEEIEQEINVIKSLLWDYDTDNAELFRKQIDQLSSRKHLLAIRNALADAKDLYNIIRIAGHEELLGRLDFRKFRELLQITEDRLNFLRLKNSADDETINLINEAMEDIVFEFVKRKEVELRLADDLHNALSRARGALTMNIDPKDPEFITLKEQLEQYFRKRDFENITDDIIQNDSKFLEGIYEQASQLNAKNGRLQSKYEGDAKFVRLHKRLAKEGNLGMNEPQLFERLINIKHYIDNRLAEQDMLDSEGYFNQEVSQQVCKVFDDVSYLSVYDLKNMSGMIIREYSSPDYA